MTRSFRIRAARPVEVPALTDIAQAAYAPYVALIGRAPPPMLQPFAEDIAEDRVLVAVTPDAPTGPEMLGYVVSRPAAEPGDWLVENLAVSPKAKGLGLGRALIEAAEARGLAAGCTRAVLYTNAAMTANLTLYPHLGYVETGRAEQSGLHRVFFAKPLG
ncbi:MAG: GNAT family N-acetyltransferase [Pseudomonadota bacterium]